MWILYEVTEYVLTSSEDLAATPDIKEFKDHVQEMVQTGVRLVLDKYSYRCTHDRDKAYLTSWLEVLVLLSRLRVGVGDIRRVMDSMTWFLMTGEILHVVAGAKLQLSKFEGILTCDGGRYEFTPFPRWDAGKYSTKRRGVEQIQRLTRFPSRKVDIR